MSIKESSVQKLQGQSNFEVQRLQISAILESKDLFNAVDHNNDVNYQVNALINRKAKLVIILHCEDGPLLQIQHCNTALKAQETLAKLYLPVGFLAEFLVCKEFFETTLDKFNSIEDYLNRIKLLSNQLKVKKIKLLKQVIVAWLLNNLTPTYEGFVTIVTQLYRNNLD